MEISKFILFFIGIASLYVVLMWKAALLGIALRERRPFWKKTVPSAMFALSVGAMIGIYGVLGMHFALQILEEQQLAGWDNVLLALLFGALPAIVAFPDKEERGRQVASP